MKKAFLLFFLVVIIVGCGDKKHTEYDKPYSDSKKWNYKDYLKKYPYGFHSCEARYRIAHLSRTKSIEALDKFISACLKTNVLSSKHSQGAYQGNYRNTCKEYFRVAWDQIATLVTEKYIARKFDTKKGKMKRYVLNTDIDKINMINDYCMLRGKAVLFEDGRSLNDQLPQKNRAQTYAEAQILVFVVNEHVKVGFGENNLLVSFEEIDSTVIFIDLERNKIIGKEMFAGEDPPSHGEVMTTYGGLVYGSISGKKCPYVHDFIADMFEKKDSRSGPQLWEEYAWKGWARSVREASWKVLLGGSIIVPSLHGGFAEVSGQTVEKVIESQRPKKIR